MAMKSWPPVLHPTYSIKIIGNLWLPRWEIIIYSIEYLEILGHLLHEVYNVY